MPAALLAGFMSKLATDPVGTIVGLGRALFAATAGIVGLAWYNSWRNTLQGMKPGSMPIPGLTNLPRGGRPDRPDKNLPDPAIPSSADLQRNAATPGAGTPLPDYSNLGPTSKAPDGGLLLQYDGKPVAAWIVPILKWARANGWRGQVRSGYRTVAEQASVNSGGRPKAPPGKSNHNFAKFPGGAVDVSEARQLAIVLSRSQYRTQLVWAGSKDNVHFSHPHNGGY